MTDKYQPPPRPKKIIKGGVSCSAENMQPHDHNLFQTFPVMWLDFTQHYTTFASLLKWTDTAQGILFPVKQVPEIHHMWAGNAVMRSNRVRVLLPHEEYREWKQVTVWPHLQHVGTTSWVCGFRITNEAGDKVMAVVETTMVFTDETFTLSKPIQNHNREHMMQMIDTSKIGLGRPEFSENDDSTASSIDPWEYSTVVRITDCDALNHINNAQYALLAEETRLYSASMGKYGNDPLCNLPACEISIAYIGQAHPFQKMDVVTFSRAEESENQTTHYRTNFSVGGQIVCKSTVTVIKAFHQKISPSL